MKSLIRDDADTITLTAPTGGWVKDELIIIRTGTSGLCGVVTNTVAAGEEVAVKVKGEFELPANAGTGLTFAVGDILYRKASDKKLTKTSTSNTRAGYCTAAKTALGTSARFMLNGG